MGGGGVPRGGPGSEKIENFEKFGSGSGMVWKCFLSILVKF